ncbi:MAG: hypothetical protein WDZ88_01845 [Candidatus Paceibacterota bacterium]
MQKKIVHIFGLGIILFLLFISGPVAEAQFGINNNAFKIDVIPKIPGANEQVTITIQSFGTDLNRANISWYINGELTQSGIGLRSFEFTTGNVGSRNDVEMVAQTVEGNFLTQDFSFIPSNVDLVWEALTYTPPFYKGRAVYTYGAPVKVVALPDLRVSGRPLNPEELFYEWKIGNKNIPSATGYGKQVYFVREEDTLNGPMTIGVTVSDRNKDLVAEKKIVLAPASPELYFYRFDPLLKTQYERAYSSGATFNTPEFTLVASPYFFPTQDKKDSSLTYRWSVNGEGVAPQTSDPSLITLRPERGVSGRATLVLDVSHPANIFSRVRRNMTLTFDGNTQTEQSFFPQ